MPTRPTPLDPRLGAVFTVGAALRAGHSPGRMRSRDLERPFHGVRRRVDTSPTMADSDAPATPTIDPERRRLLRDARACLQVAPTHAFLAGRSAAVAWGLPIDPGEQLSIGVLAPHRSLRRPGVRGLKLSAELTSVRVHDGIRLTSPATTWATLAGALSHRELVVLGDAIVCVPRDDRGRRHPERQLATPDQLAAAAHAPRRRHRDALLRALDEVRVGSMSPLETDFRLLAAAEGLPEPTLDAEIRDHTGRLLGIGDVLYAEQSTVVEVEGDHHRTSRAQWLRDLEKHAAYIAAGYELVRVGASQVRGPLANGARTTRTVLERRGWRG